LLVYIFSKASPSFNSIENRDSERLSEFLIVAELVRIRSGKEHSLSILGNWCMSFFYHLLLLVSSQVSTKANARSLESFEQELGNCVLSWGGASNF
jgi:hypothetical protein